MLLRSTVTSPFGRQVRMAMLRLGIADDIKVLPADPLDPADTLRSENPLGKMPVLTLDDGRHILDSRVILDYLDRRFDGGLIPSDLDARAEALSWQALCDGVLDAALLVVYEGRHRPAELHHQPWIDFQTGKIRRGLESLEKAPPPPERFDVATIAMACMLGYLDWRKQLDWRAEFPALTGWLDAFVAVTPEFDATRAPA